MAPESEVRAGIQRRIQLAMRVNKISHKELATKCGRSVDSKGRSVTRAWTAGRHLPPVHAFPRLAAALRVKLSWLIEGDD